jgi:uncharacterized membrane protein (DUF485 family)
MVTTETAATATMVAQRLNSNSVNIGTLQGVPFFVYAFITGWFYENYPQNFNLELYSF